MSSWERAGSESAPRRSGLASTSWATANSSSLTRGPWAPAERTSAWMPSSSSTAARSRVLVQRCWTATLTRSRALSPTLPENTLPARPALASPSIEASVRTRRSAGSDLSTPATASSWSPSVAVSSQSAGGPEPGRQLGAGLGGGTSEHQPAPFARAGAGSGLGGLQSVEVGQEAVDHPAAAVVVLEALAHDPAGERGGQRADLGAQRGDGLLPLGGDLRVAVVDDASRLGLRLLAHLGDDLRALLAGLLADARGLVAGIGDLRLELRLGGVGVGPGLLEFVELRADRLLAIGHRPVDRRDDVLRQQVEQQRERRELDQERAVGHEEVALGLGHRDDVTATPVIAGSLSGSFAWMSCVLPNLVLRIRPGRRRTSP